MAIPIDDKKTILNLATDGKKIVEIMRETGYTKPTIIKILKEFGVNSIRDLKPKKPKAEVVSKLVADKLETSKSKKVKLSDTFNREWFVEQVVKALETTLIELNEGAVDIVEKHRTYESSVLDNNFKETTTSTVTMLDRIKSVKELLEICEHYNIDVVTSRNNSFDFAYLLPKI